MGHRGTKKKLHTLATSPVTDLFWWRYRAAVKQKPVEVVEGEREKGLECPQTEESPAG